MAGSEWQSGRSAPEPVFLAVSAGRGGEMELLSARACQNGMLRVDIGRSAPESAILAVSAGHGGEMELLRARACHYGRLRVDMRPISSRACLFGCLSGTRRSNGAFEGASLPLWQAQSV
ncbi:hypothetical protein HQN90_18060 [Paenibacillus alba]|nr:hypothetical protein [Paenibacillus alba]